MKKLNLILLLAITSFFISCEKENDAAENNVEKNNAIEETSLKGDWQLTGYIQEDGKNTTLVGNQSSTINFSSVGKDYDMTITFSEDPKTVTSNGQYGVVLTSTVFGEIQTQESIAFSALKASEWRIDNNTLIFINGDEETEVLISEFSDSKMVITFDFEEILSDESSDVQFINSGTVTITLEK